MRLSKYEISKDESIEILKKCTYGTLSLITHENKPYAIPLNYVYDDAIYFHCAKNGAKIQAIQNCNDVCFTVVGDYEIIAEKYNTEYESVIVFGRISEISDIESKTDKLVLLTKKYYETDESIIREKCLKCGDRTSVYKISITKVTGKSNINQISRIND